MQAAQWGVIYHGTDSFKEHICTVDIALVLEAQFHELYYQ